MDYHTLMEAVKAARSRKKKNDGEIDDWDKFFRDMDKRKAREKKAAGAAAVPARKMFMWDRRGGYWWHATKDVIPLREFHTKKIVDSPATFGLTAAQVDKAILASTEAVRYRIEYDQVAKNAIANVRAKVLVGSIDVIYEVMALAYAKGWCRTGITSSIITIAGRKQDIAKALIEFRDSNTMMANSIGIDIMSNDGTQMVKTMVRSVGSIDNVIASLR